MNNSSNVLHYKDEEPKKTIARVRSRLAEFGIIAQENWQNVGSSIFSVNLVVLGTTINSNGKGCTKELALASAYGELAERLAFLLPFRVSPFYRLFYREISDKIKKDTCLLRQASFEQWINSKDAEIFFQSLQEQDKTNFLYNKKQKVYQKFKDIWMKRKDNCFNCFLCADFKRLKPSVKTDEDMDFKETLSIPYVILDYYYGSNGMCAGNTREEALTQGICEIIERYAQRKIVSGNYENVFDITDTCLRECSNMNAVNKLLQKSGYSIKILECSTIFNISAAAVIMRRRDGFYYVSFGCHPNLFVAAERALDELFQGYSLETIHAAFTDDYAIDLHGAEKRANELNLLKYGVGIYPPGFILGRFPKKCVEHNVVYKTNRELLDFIVDTLTQKGLKIYACRGLELGLFAYHVIILGISEAEEMLPSNKIRCSGIEDIYEKLSEITKEEAFRLAAHCELLYKSHCTTLEEILDIDKYTVYCGCETSIKGISAAMFIAMLNIRAERWQQAAIFLKKYIEELSFDDDVSSADLYYYQIVMVVLLEKAEKWSDEQIIESLQFADIDVEEILKIMNHEEDLFHEMPQLAADNLLLKSDSLRESVKEEAEVLSALLSENGRRDESNYW